MNRTLTILICGSVLSGCALFESDRSYVMRTCQAGEFGNENTSPEYCEELTAAVLVQLEQQRASARSRSGATSEESIYHGSYRLEESDCIGAVVNGVCHGSPSPDATIRMKTGQAPKCYGTVVGGRCTGPEF